jgi:hypothetical protein
MMSNPMSESVKTEMDLTERVRLLSEKTNLKPAEYALTLAVALHIGACAMRKEQRRQLEIDPAWTEVDVKAEDVNRFADYAKKLVEVLQMLCPHPGEARRTAARRRHRIAS